jgi:hypothetical protein
MVPLRGVRAGIGFRPPARDVRPVTVQNNLYNRLPSRSREIPRAAPRDASRPGAGRPNNVYADRNGDVYRKTKEGWQQREKDTWRSSGATPRPTPRPERATDRGTVARPDRGTVARPDRGTVARPPAPAPRPVTRSVPRPELDRDFSARQRGEARAQSWSRPAPQPRPAPAPQARSAPAPRPAPPSHSDTKKR